MQHRVDERRKAEFTVRLRDHETGPFVHQPVLVRQLAHEFLVGCETPPAIDQESPFNLLALPAGMDTGSVDDFLVLAKRRGMALWGPPFTGAVQENGIGRWLGKYAALVDLWEVVSEPLASSVTPEEAALACRIARDVDPHAKLVIGESVFGLPGQAERLVAYARQCLELDASLDGICAHAPAHYPWDDPASVLANLETLAEPGAPVYVKGLPIDRASEWLPVLFSCPRVAGVVCTGTPTEDLGDLRRLVTETWGTQTELETDDAGTVTFEGYHGDYEITLDGHVWKVRFADGESTEAVLTKPPTVEPPEAFDLPFVATDAESARAWQKEVRARLLEIVVRQHPRNDSPLDVETGEKTDMGPYTKQDLTFIGNEGTRIETTFTAPKGAGPFPAMVCLHGHGGDRFMVHDPESNYGGLAVPFAQRGFVTIAPSLSHLEYAPNHLWNLMRLVDVLESLEFVDKTRIGVAGLSMGGEWSMWLAATDLRIRAAAVSGWMCTTEGVLSIHNCPCWMPPGLRELCDIAEAHILIAPRPLLLESAIADGCFPIRCTEEGYRKVLEGYTVLGAPLEVRQHTFPGGHAWNGGIAYDFIEAALKP